MIATLHTTKFKTESTFAGFNYPRYIAALPRGNMADRLARRSPVVCGKTYQPNPAPVGEPGTLARSFYLGDGSQPFTRWAWCDDVDDRILHTGWFTTNDGDGDKVRGIVVRLPHGRGFLAGWAMGEGMAATVHRDVYADDVEAARAADCFAEAVAAEECDRYDLEDGEPEYVQGFAND
ncbi:hypothetical protein JT328_gp15 [Aeromonas phage BUCT551]|uniref:Uncharacterized protein n=1 Tax=Aeromonas phage BUCT551 TaxID=2776735 RepID=A0A7L8ZKP6_9CAUD|nr:hypothetical protein JT328_gp15 [Aeromonas phage BUCT551]QOI69631.1 hypothetical protein [Aeromonas phage BUCT551]